MVLDELLKGVLVSDEVNSRFFDMIEEAFKKGEYQILFYTRFRCQ